MWQAPPVVSHLVAGGMSCCRCGGLRFSTEWTRLTWAAGWSPTGQMVLHWIATSGMFLADACGLHWIATRTCLGSISAARVECRILVLTRGSVGGSAFPSTPMVLKVGGPRTASGRCCGDGDSSLVRGLGLRGAYRPSNTHEDGRPVALKTDLACKNGPAS